ncbi:hypothetical protein K435DRAFT_867673 [Dendrothele bispora CBS 962.96]|uniref:F-box domain-containing protein n=1 Tax=Dendrothele bispora (strain CBS 962.96) TaxID=1314807 RepID=A0A4S8LDM4_DENBC|nr:hypothetical protein K435DRAFT_867673 [Dendrothele bispora CBS 962.96]
MPDTSLPVELILSILEFAYYRNDVVYTVFLSRNPDYRTLAAASLINSSWRTPAQTLLFNHLNDMVAGRVLQTLSDPSFNPERRDTLLGYVRILELRLIPDDRDFSSAHWSSTFPAASMCRMADFWFLLEHCPNLYELSLRFLGVLSLGGRVKLSTRPPNLKALAVMECSSQSPILFELLELFPSVQFLAIGVEVVACPSSPPKHKLYELVMSRSLPAATFEWLVANSAGHLRILEMRDPPSPEIRETLRTLCPRIESLRIMRFNPTALEVIKACTNLKELVLMNLPEMLQLSVISDTLEHLRSVRYDVERIHKLIASLPNLKTFSGFDEPKSHNGLFEDACKSRGISISVGLWPNEEPVIPSKLPRGRSTSNFRVMNRI